MNEIRSQKEKVGEREIVIVDFTFRFFSLRARCGYLTCSCMKNKKYNFRANESFKK